MERSELLIYLLIIAAMVFLIYRYRNSGRKN